MLTRNLDQARRAYEMGNVEQMKIAHRNNTIENEERPLTQQIEDHNQSGTYIKSAVYGGLDGMITTYSVVMGVAGASLANVVVLALGIANLIGDGLSMALGDYLSTKRLSAEDSKTIIDILSKNKKVWVDAMMVEELGMLPSDDENPIKNAIVTFFSFALFGLVPIIPFIVAEIAGIDGNNPNIFYISTAVTGLFLFLLGYAKSMFTHMKWWISGLEVLLIGIIAAGASYVIGLAFRPLTGDVKG
ncbi:hypothetical protein IMG5_095220 [Ichthyophthirius multifiliis]|uniref:Integral membrane protein n=1 Tax=Ichthyophthirius multifiliis TaxID=5932 RepID=G0QRM7_ICHMU|nr:hypothetical protein IMG5_095220 [Ichthyophthirius multifiliis]EGR32126.1 hypothetical protein IMG5_095220 [Ichthyophthirius multifiliis]|eukprot:XP_004035612.1 hypothetical protein IMG5_095220 [Ichthyophthirius multifiliis]